MREIKIDSVNNDCGWFILRYENPHYLHHDLEFHQTTGGRGGSGYYATKAEAEKYLRAYRVSQMEFVIKRSQHGKCNRWYIVVHDANYYDSGFFPCLHKDLEIHPGTAYCNPHYSKDAGYYRSERIAKITLQAFKEKYNMAQDNLEINVKLNGVDTPLHEISEQTLLNLREVSKPKPVPVFQVCTWTLHNRQSRFILKITPSMRARIKGNQNHNFIVFDEDGDPVASYNSISEVDRDYDNRREFRLNEV